MPMQTSWMKMRETEPVGHQVVRQDNQRGHERIDQDIFRVFETRALRQ
jgi:hypothetical protein